MARKFDGSPGELHFICLGDVSIDRFRHEEEPGLVTNEDIIPSQRARHRAKRVQVRDALGGAWLLADLIQQFHETEGTGGITVYAPDVPERLDVPRKPQVPKKPDLDNEPVGPGGKLRNSLLSSKIRRLNTLPVDHCNVSYIEVERVSAHKDVKQKNVYRSMSTAGHEFIRIDSKRPTADPTATIPADRAATTPADAKAATTANPKGGRAVVIINHVSSDYSTEDERTIAELLDQLDEGYAKFSVILKARWPHLMTPATRRFRDDGTAYLESSAVFSKLKEFADRLLVVIDADDIRANDITISRGISWDRTAADLVLALKENKRLNHLLALKNVVVRFGIDGAVHLCKDAAADRFDVMAYYDPSRAEGDFAEQFDGSMSGFGTVFCASLALDHETMFTTREIGAGTRKKTITETRADLEVPIRQAIVSSRRLLEYGYKISSDQTIAIDHHEVFDRKDQLNRLIAKSNVPSDTYRHRWQSWSFLSEIAGDELIGLAKNIVQEGQIPTNKYGLPQGTFGALETLDRAEIEGYRSVRKLMREYLDTATAPRPLSIAVFGQPGSGKSFGVKQVAASLRPEEDHVECDFNISQFTSTQDLAVALQTVRDNAVKGKVPLVFLDEFDSKFEDQPLGWLKYFLAPMQDGAFRDGQSMHPIGRAILIFAGGTSHSFEQFRDQFPGNVTVQKETKLPDFVSRLRGYVNTAGPNKRDPNDIHFVVRRAVSLRGLLSRNRKKLMDGKRINIDSGVLHAFLMIDEYRHGIRSIEALIDMSTLANKSNFDRSALPTGDQMNMHVNADQFAELMADAGQDW